MQKEVQTRKIVHSEGVADANFTKASMHWCVIVKDGEAAKIANSSMMTELLNNNYA
jgi:hypothetical protein